METAVKRVHFIGIGGIGMSALARYFLSDGWQVSGSDLSHSATTGELKKEGAVIYIGKHSENNLRRGVGGYPALVVYNNAIGPDNPELLAARKMNIWTHSYSEVLGELTRRYKTIAIAGSHGKSTTTALTALVLIAAGFDPTVIIGTKLKEFSIRRHSERSEESHRDPSPRRTQDDRYAVNFRRGRSEWLVIEADEWKGAFWNYSPFLATITNIDKEHLDFYKNFANVKKSFARFRKNCRKVVATSRDPKLAAEIRKVLKIPGDHNIQNALNVWAIAKELKIPKTTFLRAVGRYRGAWRRMEYRGNLTSSDYVKLKVMVFDDYAHHPTEIKATLVAFKQKWARNPLICVFQPHQADRLRRLFNDFKTAFKSADQVIILPEYKVAGREEKFDPRFNAAALAHSIGAIYIPNPKNLRGAIKKILFSRFYFLDSIVVMMGAGDIINYTKQLVN